MMNLENVVRIGDLLERYGGLLSERTRVCAVRYYHEDWTLAEIAEELGISRQAVHDHLQRGGDQLEQFEQVLGLLRRRDERARAADALLAVMSPDERLRYAQAIRALAE